MRHTYLFVIDDHVVADAAVNGNEAPFINHSCVPNRHAVIDGAASQDFDSEPRQVISPLTFMKRHRRGQYMYDNRGQGPLEEQV